MQERTCTLPGRPIMTATPPQPTCPPWCSPDACQLAYDRLDGWTGTHANPLQMIATADAWWAVQVLQFAAPDGTSDAGISLDTVATAVDWLTADDADRLAAALRDAAARLRAA